MISFTNQVESCFGAISQLDRQGNIVHPVFQWTEDEIETGNSTRRDDSLRRLQQLQYLGKYKVLTYARTISPGNAKKQEGSIFRIGMAFWKSGHHTKFDAHIHTKQSQHNCENLFWHHRHPLITGFPMVCACIWGRVPSRRNVLQISC